MARGPSHERLWLEVTLAFGISVLLLFLNLFGRGAVIERYGQGVFNAVFGPGLYGAGERHRVSVVLFQDADLAEMGLTWPIPYREHARMLAALREMSPLGVMIDFLLVDPREDASLPVLVQELQAYREAGIPVFLARPPDRAPRPDVLIPLREPLTHLVPVPHVVGRDSTYPLSVDQCEPKGDPDDPCQERARPTAAPAAYAAVCGGPRSWAECRPPLLVVKAQEAPRGPAGRQRGRRGSGGRRPRHRSRDGWRRGGRDPRWLARPHGDLLGHARGAEEPRRPRLPGVGGPGPLAAHPARASPRRCGAGATA